MAVLVETQNRPRPVAAVQRWVFDTAPLWVLTAGVLAMATLVHGYWVSDAAVETAAMAADPFTQRPGIGAWRYQSPIGPMLSWAVGARTADAVALVDYLVTIVAVVLSAAAVARWASDYAARLFLLAYFCSPQAWAGTAALGAFDMITVAALTVCAVAPVGACLAGGVVLGFNHFEQGGIALVAIAVIRVVIRREAWRPVVSAFIGLAVGKVALLGYQLANGIDTDGRTQFIRDKGLADIVSGWRGHETVLIWAVFNVLWVGMIWMAATMPTRARWTAAGLMVLLTLPVMITYDLSRVYRIVTWPLVLLLVLYAADWPDRRLVQRWALLLAVAACFVPRTELWHGGIALNY